MIRDLLERIAPTVLAVGLVGYVLGATSLVNAVVG